MSEEIKYGDEVLGYSIKNDLWFSGVSFIGRKGNRYIIKSVDPEWLDEFLCDAVKLKIPPINWISIKDNLPKKGVYVLCGSWDEGVPFVGSISIIDGKWSNIEKPAKEVNPTYWYPLSEIPKLKY